MGKEKDKLFKISVLTLLVLILVSLLSIASTFIHIDRGDNDFYIELGADEFEELGEGHIEPGLVQITESYYTFNEFSTFTKQTPSTINDIVNYALNNNYLLEYEDEYVIEMITEISCSFDEIRQRELCAVSALLIDKEGEVVIISKEQFEEERSEDE